MTDLVRISIVLCALFGCFYCSDDSDDGGGNRAYIGQTCHRDHDCIDNAYCQVQLTCQCEPFHSPTPDQSTCIATIGRSCTDDKMCATITNAECKQGLCICKDDFVQDINNASNCIRRPVTIGELCQTQAVCKDSFGLANCINEKCECYSGFHYVNETNTCIKSQGLYYHCKYDYECYLDAQSLDALECKQEQCVCKEGERCSKGSLITAIGMLIMILLLLQQRIV